MIARRHGLLAAVLLAMGAADAAAQARTILPGRDRPLRGSAPQVYAVGAAEGADHEMFGEVAGVAFDRADNLYVLDRTGARVLVFDRAGRFVRQVGKRGDGPGELQAPMSIALAADGTLFVHDLARPGVSLFRPDGTFARSFRMDGWMPSSRQGIAWHPRGGLVGTFRAGLGETVRGGSFRREENATPLLYVPLDGGEPRPLFNVPQTWTVEGSSPSEGQMTVRVSAPPTFSPRVLTDVLPDGRIALAFTPGYSVQLLDADGRQTRLIQRPMRIRRTTEADRERARAAARERMRSGRGTVVISRGSGGPAPRVPAMDRQAIERRLGEMRFADTIPALRGLRVAPSGLLWIERTAEDVEAAGPIDLVTPGGEYRGTLTTLALPDAISPGGLAAFVEVDDLGVERVVVRRLPAAWR